MSIIKMRKSLLLVLLFVVKHNCVNAQTDSITSYTKKTYMVPMWDGTKLFTLVLSPTGNTKPLPFLIERTPYGSDFPLKEDSAISVNDLGYYQSMAKEGYIFRSQRK